MVKPLTFSFINRELQPDEEAGSGKSWNISHWSIGKENHKQSPYLLANEWVCGRLGHFLALPIPPFALTRRGLAGRIMFSSLRYSSRNNSGEVAPCDVDPVRCVSCLPDLCTGICLFDVLIANSDRHHKNLKVDSPESPSEICIFDHDKAFFGTKGPDHLKNAIGKVEVATPKSNRLHFLAKELTDPSHISKWLERIEAIPSHLIRDIIEEARHVHSKITESDCDFGSKWLIERCQSLRHLIKDQAAWLFPKINKKSLIA